MGPDLTCVSVERFSQNTCVKSDLGEETVTRENLIVGLTEATPAEGQLVKSSVTLVYKSEPFPIFEIGALYTSELKKKSLVLEKPVPPPAAKPAASPAPTPAPTPSPVRSSS